MRSRCLFLKNNDQEYDDLLIPSFDLFISSFDIFTPNFGLLNFSFNGRRPFAELLGLAPQAQPSAGARARVPLAVHARRPERVILEDPGRGAMPRGADLRDAFLEVRYHGGMVNHGVGLPELI